MTRLNIAVISTAHVHTKGFIDNIVKGTDGRKVYAIWDDVVDRGQRYAAGCGATFVPDLAKLLADPAVDGFMICAENTRHGPLLERVLPVGKPVMCEKPLLTTGIEIQQVRRLLSAKATPLVCGYFKPFSGEMRAIKAAVDAGTFGTLTSVRYKNAHHAAYGRWFDNPDLTWFTDPKLAGGGAFMDMGTHAIHLLRSLFGPVTAITATIANRSGQYPQVDDHGLAMLRFAARSGQAPLLGVVEASWIQQGGPSGLEIQGSAAALWHDGKSYVIGAPGKPATAVVALPGRPATVDRLVACISGTLSAQELKDDQEAFLDAVVIMEAAYRSNQSGGWVEIGSAAHASR